MAAKQGWCDSVDIFFLLEDGDAERQQRTCLRLRDNAGLSVLDHARMTGVIGELNGGESIIVSEMRKRAIDIPPNSLESQMRLRPRMNGNDNREG
jgi:hypothetical protein